MERPEKSKEKTLSQAAHVRTSLYCFKRLCSLFFGSLGIWSSLGLSGEAAGSCLVYVHCEGRLVHLKRFGGKRDAYKVMHARCHLHDNSDSKLDIL